MLLGDLTGGRPGRADDGIDLLGERTVAGDEPLVASIMAAVAIIMPVTVVTASASPGLYARFSRSALTPHFFPPSPGNGALPQDGAGADLAGLGGWTFVTRVSLATPQATGMAFFGLYGSTAALATTLALSAVVSCIGNGFQRGTHTRWQLVANDASGAPTLVDMGASFASATGGVLTLTIAAVPNAGSIWVRVLDEVSGAVFEQEVTADLPAANQFLAPRLFMNNGATAAAVAFDCSGVYLETDY